MTQGYGGISGREVRVMMRRGNAVMAGIREERKYRRQIGAQESNRWMQGPDMDRWDRRVNWALLGVCAAFLAGMLALCWPALMR